MITFVASFTVALVVSLILTPIVKWIGLKVKAVDAPGERKVHTDESIPRIGGIALYLAFMGTFFGWIFLSPEVGSIFENQLPRMTGFAIGSLIIVATGVIDDLRGLSWYIKLILQLVAGLVAYHYGIRISVLYLPFIGNIPLGSFGIVLTLLWIAGITNAINLIDGLDGLAAGVAFIATLTLFAISLYRGQLESALFSAVMAGTVAGFLRYNLNPAKIFMGDSGAYFLGYALAVFSILSPQKYSTAVALVIPIMALGFPIMDTLTQMLRRFIRSINLIATEDKPRSLFPFAEMFHADNEHVHHKLLEKGYTQKTAVVIIYLLACGFGLFAFLATALRDEATAAILFFVAIIVFVFIRNLGYIEFQGIKDDNFLKGFYLRFWGDESEDNEEDEN